MKNNADFWPAFLHCLIRVHIVKVISLGECAWQTAVLLPHLCDVGKLTQIELVMELDSRRQETQHHITMQLNGSIYQLIPQLTNRWHKATRLKLAIQQ